MISAGDVFADIDDAFEAAMDMARFKGIPYAILKRRENKVGFNVKRRAWVAGAGYRLERCIGACYPNGVIFERKEY